MTVVASNLALRFYVSLGWTEEKIIPLIESSVHPEPLHYKDSEHLIFRYWVPEVGTILNIEKLMKIVTKVDRTFDDHPQLSDEEFLKKYNW